MPGDRRILPALALLLASCGGGATEPRVHSLRFVAGAGVSDTVDAQPVQALVVEVRDAGQAASGMLVRFETRPVGTPTSGSYGALLSTLAGRWFTSFIAETTDARGRASVMLHLGHVVGPAYVVATVPELGIVDSTVLTVKPGAVARVITSPGDTALFAGKSFTVRATTQDRYGNTVGGSLPVALSTTAPELTVSGTSVAATRIGRASYDVTVGDARTTSWVSVVPEGTLAASTADGLSTFLLDGSSRHTISVDHPGMMSWAPDGSGLAYDLAPGFGYGTPAQFADDAGHVRPLSATRASDLAELSPAWAHAGDWAYFAAIPAGGIEAFRLFRVHADGSGLEQVPNEAAEDDFYPSVSPDGTRLVYVRRVGAGADYLRVLDVATGAVSRIDIPGHSPAWSPVGDDIAYVDLAAGSPIRIMRADGTGIRQVSAPGVPYRRGLTWSPDGRYLVAHNESTGLLELLDATTGVTLPLPYSRGMAFPAWKP